MKKPVDGYQNGCAKEVPDEKTIKIRRALAELSDLSVECQNLHQFADDIIGEATTAVDAFVMLVQMTKVSEAYADLAMRSAELTSKASVLVATLIEASKPE